MLATLLMMMISSGSSSVTAIPMENLNVCNREMNAYITQHNLKVLTASKNSRLVRVEDQTIRMSCLKTKE